MLPYIAPQQDMLLSLLDVAGGRALLSEELDDAMVSALLTEAAKLAEEVLAPQMHRSDRNPPTLHAGRVTVGPEMHAAHRHVSDKGWLALPFAEDLGGLALPWSVSSLALELADAANVAFALSLCMTQGCAEAIVTHGSQDQIQTYVPPLLDGRFVGTMQLTEAGAGSDVGALKTLATPRRDGSWSLKGTKIYISWGDSDLADNIVHLVLARTPGAPSGTKGLSLFLVPSVLPDGRRNRVQTAGIEAKLGIHGSPTCTLVHEGSTGWLVGEERGGMAAMFTMMNKARIGVGFQGAGVSERSLQAARAYAENRVQGGMALIQHMDVRRNLLLMKALTCASRDLGYSALVAGDLARLGGTKATRHQRRIDLLTPVAKAFMTDAAVEVSNLAIQVHGGLGVIEEAGVAQLARDCRVFTIYEGTNGIQALDLIGRKTLRDQGQGVRELLADVRATLASAQSKGLEDLAAPVRRAADQMAAALPTILATDQAPEAQAAIATPYLQALAYLVAGWGFVKRALATQGDREQAHLAAFFMAQVLPRLDLGLAALGAGSRPLIDHRVELI